MGVQYMSINGNNPPKVRQKTLEHFRAAGRDDPRVLIISTVGITGLNLACANIVIMLVSASSNLPRVQQPD